MQRARPQVPIASVLCVQQERSQSIVQWSSRLTLFYAQELLEAQPLLVASLYNPPLCALFLDPSPSQARNPSWIYIDP